MATERAVLKDFEYDVYGNSIAFDGNTNLKKVRTKLAYTKEHLEEWGKCKDNWQWFAEGYHYIMDIDTGLHKIQMRDYQVDMVNNFTDHRFNIVLASRQIGKSTAFEVFCLHYLLFNKDKTVAILANKAEQAKDLLRKIKQAYELLPKWLQQGVKSWNQNSIRLENGCACFAASTSSSAIRGRSISLLIIDEFAFIPRNVFEEFYSSTYPTISSGAESKVIFVSTPCGMNHYYKFWLDATEQRNKFVPYRVDWWQVPSRDAKWKDETLSNIGKVRFNQEYGNEFLGSAETLIDSDCLKALAFKDPLPLEELSLADKLLKKFHQYVRVYEDRKINHIYSIGVDSARMTEERAGDNLSIQVLDITQVPYKQVAIFNAKSGFTYLQLPEVIYAIGKYYNWAYVFIENNDIGQEVANNLNYDYEYENCFFETGSTAGFKTTKKTKRLGYSNLKLFLENNKLIINDFETVSELSTFIRWKDSYRAEAGYNDDLAMALIASIFFLQRKEFDNFDDSIDMMRELFSEKVEAVDEDVPSFGVIDDGSEDHFKGEW